MDSAEITMIPLVPPVSERHPERTLSLFQNETSHSTMAESASPLSSLPFGTYHALYPYHTQDDENNRPGDEELGLLEEYHIAEVQERCKVDPELGGLDDLIEMEVEEGV